MDFIKRFKEIYQTGILFTNLWHPMNKFKILFYNLKLEHFR